MGVTTSFGIFQSNNLTCRQNKTIALDSDKFLSVYFSQIFKIFKLQHLMLNDLLITIDAQIK